MSGPEQPQGESESLKGPERIAVQIGLLIDYAAQAANVPQIAIGMTGRKRISDIAGALKLDPATRPEGAGPSRYLYSANQQLQIARRRIEEFFTSQRSPQNADDHAETDALKKAAWVDEVKKLINSEKYV